MGGSVLPQSSGSIRLFRVLGITVFLHWSWFLVAVWQIQNGWTRYEDPAWRILEYLALFFIVLLHEFGHALACRSVGGRSEQIVLWPLGGVAYVQPPRRPGALLWSIAAGPLVNVALIPITYGFVLLSENMGWPDTLPDRAHFVYSMFQINLVILCFNILPIYPLDGGQMLQALLWFFTDEVKSLKIASVLGMIGGVALLGWAITSGYGAYTMVLCAFLIFQAFSGYKRALALRDWMKQQGETPGA